MKLHDRSQNVKKKNSPQPKASYVPKHSLLEAKVDLPIFC